MWPMKQKKSHGKQRVILNECASRHVKQTQTSGDISGNQQFKLTQKQAMQNKSGHTERVTEEA